MENEGNVCCWGREGKVKGRQIAVAKLFRPHLNIKLCRVEEIIAAPFKDTRVPRKLGE